jgi:hypothetical protein
LPNISGRARVNRYRLALGRPKEQVTMAAHVRVLAFLNIALGGFGLLLAVVVFGVAGSLPSLLELTHPATEVPVAVVQMVATFIVCIVLALSLPWLISGFGLLGFHAWARVLTLILCGLNLLNIPFGTALGLYGFWVLLKPETEMLFQSQAART